MEHGMKRRLHDDSPASRHCSLLQCTIWPPLRYITNRITQVARRLRVSRQWGIARAAPCGEPAAKDMKHGSCHLKIERRTIMAVIEAEVVINGPQEKVFDVVTIAGLWPQWAVLARAVARVTERPFQLGDPVYECVRTPTRPQAV